MPQQPSLISSKPQTVSPASPSLGPLDALLGIPGLSDIFVNSAQDIWYEAGGQLVKAPLSFENQQAVTDLAQRLIISAGGRLDSAHPAADVQGEGGYRVHAVLPPISGNSTLLSIRFQPRQAYSLDDLQARGMLAPETANLLLYLLARRQNFLISGGTGSGKTTLLSALLAHCPGDERLVFVEDTPELKPAHPHCLFLRARAANSEGQGQVDLSELIRQALRMRPSRLILGECRGPEVMDMLTAMNTGHAGSGSTLHANSARAVPARLYAMASLAGVAPQALALQAATALGYIIHLERVDGQRQVAEVAQLVGDGGGGLEVLSLCRQQAGRRGRGLVWQAGSEDFRAGFEGWKEETRARENAG